MAKKRRRAPGSYRKRYKKRQQKAQEQEAQLGPKNDVIENAPPKPVAQEKPKRKKGEQNWTTKQDMVRTAIARDTDWRPSLYLVKKVIKVAGKARTSKRYKESIGQAARTVEFVIGKGVRKRIPALKIGYVAKFLRQEAFKTI
jgi:hypothetical protein